MALGIIGRKRGMTRVFTEDGTSVPVTVIEAVPNRVMELTDPDASGTRRVRVAWGRKRRGLINRPSAGNLAKVGVDSAEGLAEFSLVAGDGDGPAAGAEIKVEVFVPGQKVDVTGTSIGKGYAGVIKRHHFRSQRASHGASVSHRTPGSTGQNQSPGRVFKGKRMAGQLGNVRRTTLNLEVVRVDAERNLLLIKGAVPGATGGKVVVRPAVKAGKE